MKNIFHKPIFMKILKQKPINLLTLLMQFFENLSTKDFSHIEKKKTHESLNSYFKRLLK